MSNQFDSDRLLASAARFLIDGGEDDAASVLLSCSLDVYGSGDHWMDGDRQLSAVGVNLSGPRVAYDILKDGSNPITEAIRRALEAVLPSDTYWRHIDVQAELLDIDPGWRTELLEIARGKGVSNQAVQRPKVVWNNLNFRSHSELRIAQALDRFGVLFLPNCKARLGVKPRQNREPDFLICHNGKWGILEVDGEDFHPPSRTAQDHERDRLFQSHGILVVQHFAADECFENADGVVKKFLDILRNS